MPRSTSRFFVLTFAITFGLQLPAALAQLGVIPGPVQKYMGLLALGALGPTVAAMLCVRREPDSGGVRALFRQFRSVNVGARWMAVALFGFTAVYVAGHAVAVALGVRDAGAWLYPPVNGEHVAGLLVMPVVEEIGWRGYALPRLQAKYTRLHASLLLGAAWAAWHTMMFIVQRADGQSFSLGMLLILAGSVIYSWIYNHGRQSLFIAWLAHVGSHINNPMHALPANGVPFVVFVIAVVAAAVAVVVFDRGAWRAQPAPA